MDATEKLQAFLAKLPTWKRVEAAILANFQMLYQDGAEIQHSLREICEHLDTLQNSFKSYSCLDGVEVEAWIHNPFLSEIHWTEDVDLAIDSLRLSQKNYHNWNLTQKCHKL